MALRLRRGTDAERQSITPLAGELIYTTDTKELYVGDGSTIGGVLVSSALSDDPAPTLSADLSLNGHNIIGTGNINIDGTITATGTVNLGDGVEDNVVVGGQIGSSLIPGTSSTYNLGDNISRWNEVHAVNVIAEGAAIDGELSVGSLVTGGNIVAADSTVLYNASTGGLTVSGVIQGAGFVGTLFTDDSNVLIDAINKDAFLNNVSLTGDLDLIGDISCPGVNIDLRNTDPEINLKLRRFVPQGGNHTDIIGTTQGSYSSGNNIFISRGTLVNPETVQSGDTLNSDISFAHDGNDYTITSAIVSTVDPNGTVSAGAVPGLIALYTLNDGNVANLKGLRIDSRGWVDINVSGQSQATLDINGFAKLAILDTAPASPADGMVAIASGDQGGGEWDPLSVGAKQQMVVYLGGAWRQISIEP